MRKTKLFLTAITSALLVLSAALNISAAGLMPLTSATAGGASSQTVAAIGSSTPNVSFDTAATLTLGVSESVTTDSRNPERFFRFIPETSAFYTFESITPASGCGSVKRVANCLREQLAESDADRMTVFLQARFVYYFIVSAEAGRDSGRFLVKLSRATRYYAPSEYVPEEAGWEVSGRINVLHSYNVMTVTPDIDREYIFMSTRGSIDPAAWLYDSRMRCVASNDDYLGSNNFKIRATLRGGETYYLVTASVSGTGAFTQVMLREAVISNTAYSRSFSNVGHPGWEIWGPGSYTLYNGNGPTHIYWYFEECGGGYYGLAWDDIFVPTEYLGITNTNYEYGNLGSFYGTYSCARWKIFRFDGGGTPSYVFVPYDAPDAALAMYPGAIDRRTVAYSGLTLLTGERFNTFCRWYIHDVDYSRYSH